jgi:hypothetical protein
MYPLRGEWFAPRYGPFLPLAGMLHALQALLFPIALTKSRYPVQATGKTSLKAAELMTGLPGSSLGSANQQLCTMQAWSTDKILRKACMEAALKGYAMRLVCCKLTSCCAWTLASSQVASIALAVSVIQLNGLQTKDQAHKVHEHKDSLPSRHTQSPIASGMLSSVHTPLDFDTNCDECLRERSRKIPGLYLTTSSFPSLCLPGCVGSVQYNGSLTINIIHSLDSRCVLSSCWMGKCLWQPTRQQTNEVMYAGADTEPCFPLAMVWRSVKRAAFDLSCSHSVFIHSAQWEVHLEGIAGA